METETVTEGTAVEAALVSCTAITEDVCDCIGVYDWTHSAVLCASWNWSMSVWCYFGAKKNNGIRKTRKANQGAWIIYIDLLLTAARAVSCLEFAFQKT